VLNPPAICPGVTSPIGIALMDTEASTGHRRVLSSKISIGILGSWAGQEPILQKTYRLLDLLRLVHKTGSQISKNQIPDFLPPGQAFKWEQCQVPTAYLAASAGSQMVTISVALAAIQTARGQGKSQRSPNSLAIPGMGSNISHSTSIRTHMLLLDDLSAIATPEGMLT
jgi:hypothetical protein